MPWNTFFGRAREIEASRRKLLGAIAGAKDLTFVRIWGNVGDQLIYAGARQLLARTRYTEISLRDIEQAHGHTAVLSGGGGWCQSFQGTLPKALPILEERFDRVVIWPSSFETSADAVRDALVRTKALVFARERTSFEHIRHLCRADLAHDSAFFFDFRPYRQRRQPSGGLLQAYRTDHEAQGLPIPEGNNDISMTCESLDEWLWTIARHGAVETDRAHVMLAAAMLGKRVDYRASNYHKVPGIAEFALRGYPVYRLPGDLAPETTSHTFAHAS